MNTSDWLTVISTIVAVIAGAGISWVFFRTQLLADIGSLKNSIVKLDIPRDINYIVSPKLGEVAANLQELSHQINNLNSLDGLIAKQNIPRDINAVINPRLGEISSNIRDLHASINHIQKTDVESGVVRALSHRFKEIQDNLQEIKIKTDVIEKIDHGKDLASIKNTVENLDKDLNSAVKEILSNVKSQQYELAEKIQKEFSSQSEKASNVVKQEFLNEINKFINNSHDQDELLKSLLDSFMNGMNMMGKYQDENIKAKTSDSIETIERKITASVDNVLEEVLQLKEKVIALPSY